VNGEDREVWKDPVEGHDKASKRGRLALHRVNGKWVTVKNGHADDPGDVLRTVFRDGEVVVRDTVKEVRERVKG
jgi:nicotinamide phosphoribosyltransferase